MGKGRKKKAKICEWEKRNEIFTFLVIKCLAFCFLKTGHSNRIKLLDIVYKVCNNKLSKFNQVAILFVTDGRHIENMIFGKVANTVIQRRKLKLFVVNKK